MAWPRLVFGETSRERELRALADGLQAERSRTGRRTAADEKAHAAAIAALRDQLVQVIHQRNAARVVQDDLADRLKAAEAERDAAIAERDAARQLHKAAEAELDEARAECWTLACKKAATKHEARKTISDVAASLRCILEAIEPDDSQDGRPATDCGADGAGREPE